MKRSKLRYHLKYTNDVKTYYSFEVDFDTFVEVIGDGDNGCYEWIIRDGDEIVEYSNIGWGDMTTPLRDALCVYHGTPAAISRELGIKSPYFENL